MLFLILSSSSAFAVKDYNIKSGDTSFLFVNGTSGNVGIGTITSAAKLEVVGAGTGTGVALQVDDSMYAPKFTILDNGNVGIGSINPAQLLDVAGVLNLSGTGNSSFAGNLGIGVTEPTHALEVSGEVYASVFNGAFIGDGAGITGLSTVTGWTVSGSDIYNSNSGNVGIGSTVPQANLDVYGTTFPVLRTIRKVDLDGLYASVLFARKSDSPAHNDGVMNYFQVQNSNGNLVYAGAFGARLTNVTSGTEKAQLLFNVANNNIDPGTNYIRMVINGDGNVGIGTITPVAKLEVVGAGMGTGVALQVDDSMYAPKFTILDNGNVGIGSINPSQLLDINGNLKLSGAGDSYFAGNVGVGVPTPTHALEVVGNVFATSFTGDGSTLTGLSTATGWGLLDNNIYNSNSLNVGIGTSTPVAKLEVVGAGTDTGTAFQVDDSTYAPKFTVLDNGNVGVGSAFPAQLLDINGNLKVSGAGDSSFTGNVGVWVTAPTHALEVSGDVYASVFNGSFIGDGSGLTNISTVAGWTVSGNNIYNSNSANVGIGTITPVAKLEVVGAGTGTGTAFRVDDSTYAPRFTVLDNGNVGIGTVSPGKLLPLGSPTWNSGSGSRVLEIQSTGANLDSGLFLTNSASSSVYGSFWYNSSAGDLNIENSYSSGQITFYKGAIQTMKINSLGNVGIGTTTPVAKLEVVGAGTGTGIAFQIDNSAYSPKVTVLDNGNVGIGVLTPTQLVDVDGYVKATGFIGDGSGLTGLSAAITGWGSLDDNIYNSNSGNVGIGSIVPAAKLNVVGATIIKGDVIIDLQ